MSGELAVGESVSFAEHEILKRKHETLLRDHETTILAIELLEKKLSEAVLPKKEDEYWEKKYLELQKNLETVEKDIQDLMSSEVTGEDSGTAATLGEDRKVVIEISDDDEGNGSESSGGRSDSENQEKLSFYI
ncbi:Uncharacterized protein Rs2_37344 [Raphanus sativus]|uniref:Uncharacterized protein LOC108821326 n=1 Tax=Raphanus sativus TaxID=3726 RepID=A0A6J0KQS8_RAPSA|nr:uncharacterized protein LOC108821326 [Raphanus sativus]XP_056847762.1 uncharacterized protein LOC130498430 [Raphanus sativus]KAJ4880289.1 Uncharacterized protein Rs2_37344 [Raphanus sativus]